METFIKVKCDNCLNEFNKRKKDIKNLHVFCCKKCENEFRHKNTFENRVCPICGKEFECSKKSTQKFCSRKCVNENSKTIIGIKNPRFKSELIKCKWCNSEFYLKQSRINKNGNNFCSNKCRQEWFSKDYSQREDSKEKQRKIALKMLSDGSFSHVDTECQIKINNLLEELNIMFTNEYNFDNMYSVDNYLKDYNLIIEVMGDYWHCNPIKYKYINYKNQVDRIIRDKAKHSYIKNKYNIEILYLWEYDIMNNLNKCKNLIIDYIKNKGILSDYNSFNYNENNKIISYIDYSSEDLNKIIDIKLKQKISKKDESKWITFNCEICGKEKEQLIGKYNLRKHHYCSKECSYIGQSIFR